MQCAFSVEKEREQKLLGKKKHMVVVSHYTHTVCVCVLICMVMKLALSPNQFVKFKARKAEFILWFRNWNAEKQSNAQEIKI